jgi:hypothetical protein
MAMNRKVVCWIQFEILARADWVVLDIGRTTMILDARLANTPKWYVNPPPGFNMRVPTEILKSVVFLSRVTEVF